MQKSRHKNLESRAGPKARAAAARPAVERSETLTAYYADNIYLLNYKKYKSNVLRNDYFTKSTKVMYYVMITLQKVQK
jgi:hypothetical protein